MSRISSSQESNDHACSENRFRRREGCKTDFDRLKDLRLQGLQEIERFFVEHTDGGRPKPGGLLAQDTGARLFALGSYVGSIIRQQGKGEWIASDGDARAEINIAVRLPSGTMLWPVQRVMKRLQNGPEDNIYHYGLDALEALDKR